MNSPTTTMATIAHTHPLIITPPGPEVGAGVPAMAGVMAIYIVVM